MVSLALCLGLGYNQVPGPTSGPAHSFAEVCLVTSTNQSESKKGNPVRTTLTTALLSTILLLALAPPAMSAKPMDVTATEKGAWTIYDFASPAEVTSITNVGLDPFVSSDGAVWIPRHDGVAVHRGGHWVLHTAADGLMNGPVTGVAQSADGVIWVVGQHDGRPGASRYDGRAFETFAAPDTTAGTWCAHPALDSRGHLWIAAAQRGGAPLTLARDSTAGGHGLLRFDGLTWQRYTATDGLIHNRVYDVTVADDDAIWVATFNGVSRFAAGAWTNYTHEDGLASHKSYQIHQSGSGKIWVTHGQGQSGLAVGISSFDGEEWRVHTASNGTPFPVVLSIHGASDGVLWFGVAAAGRIGRPYGALIRRANGSWLAVTESEGLPGDSVRGVHTAPDGSVWLAIGPARIARYGPSPRLLGTVSGRALKPDGSPLVDAGIRLDNVSGRWLAGTVSDSSGGFRLEAHPGRSRVYLVQGKGGDTLTVDITGGQSVRDLHLTAEAIEPGRRSTLGRGKGHFRTYTVADGLGSDAVWAIQEDSRGDLWFSTSEGFTRYDGLEFVTCTQADGAAGNRGGNSIVEDRDGHIWFPTDGGVSRFDPRIDSPSTAFGAGSAGTSEQTGQAARSTRSASSGQAGSGQAWQNYTTQHGLANNGVRALLLDRNGTLWAGGHGGISRFDPSSARGDTTWFPEAPGFSEPVRRIHESRQGDLWFIRSVFSVLMGAVRYDGESWSSPSKLRAYRILDVVEDAEGSTWFAGNGLTRTDGQALVQLSIRDGFPGGIVFSAYRDRQDNLWFGQNNRVLRYGGRGFTVFSAEEGLTGSRFRAITQDSEGYLWFGSSPGANRYSGSEFLVYSEEEGLPSVISSAFSDRAGRIWLSGSTGSGISGTMSYIHGDTVRTFRPEDGLPAGAMSMIGQDTDGALWSHATRGLARYDGKRFASLPSGWWINTGLVDASGDPWIGTRGGVGRYAGFSTELLTTEDGLPNNFVTVLSQDRRGVIWVGTIGGLASLDRDRVQSYTAADGLAGNIVTAIFQDGNGTMWIGTSTGLTRQDQDGWKTFTTRDGLPHNYVLDIAEDRGGDLWIGTPLGAARFDGHVFQALNRGDGLGNNRVEHILQAKDGALWFIHPSQVTRYEPREPRAPSIRVDAVLADRTHHNVSTVSTPSTSGLVSFEFTGISKRTRDDGMVYRYRLVGHEDEWQATKEQRVEYTNLPRGDYTFEVEAVDRDLTYSDAPATVALSVYLPYGQLGLYASLGVAIVLIAFQTRRVVRHTRQLAESNRELEGKTQELEGSNQALSDANHELFEVNVALQRERSVERIRGQVQSMDRAEDFDRVLSDLSSDLTEVGLTFDSCEIDVIHASPGSGQARPDENPTMALFEANGFRYTTYTLNPEGGVVAESFALAAPFPAVNRQTIERFIADERRDGDRGSAGGQLRPAPIDELESGELYR